jgi:hypothetical protein
MTEGAEFQPRQACTTEAQAGVPTDHHQAVTAGRHIATARGVFLLGMTSMAAVAKVLGLLVMAIVPGGLLFLAAFILAKLVAERMRAGHRGSDAFSGIKLRDVWSSAKQAL